MLYWFYPKLGQIVLNGHWKKSDITRIHNVSRGVDLYNEGDAATVKKIVENKLTKTVVKLSAKNTMTQGMESDDVIIVYIDGAIHKDPTPEEIRQQREDSQKAYEAQSKIEQEAERKRIKEANRMGYKKAERIGKKSLLELIAEKKFEEGKTLGGSIKGAVSDKFKAKVTRIKKAFDPLGWVSGILGKGIIGRSATTVLGRAFGRRQEDIEAFGGYKRKGGAKRGDTKHTKIGPGQARNLETGDSSADILAKMYNFMLKDYNRQKLQRELDEDFRKEQVAENERRHQKLVEEIQKLTKGKAEPAEKKDAGKTMLDTILGGFKSIIGTVKGFALSIVPIVAGVFALVKGFIKPLTGMTGMLEGMLEKIAKVVITIVEPLVSGLIRAAIGVAMNRVFSSFMSIITFLGGLIAKGITSVSKSALGVLGPTVAGLLGVATGAAVGVGIGKGAEAVQSFVDATQEKAFTSGRPGGEADQLRKAQAERDAALLQIEKREGPMFPGSLKSEREQVQFEYGKKRSTIQEAQNRYFASEIQPIVEAKGYHVDELRRATGKAGTDLDLPMITDKNGEELSQIGYNVLALEVLEERMIKAKTQELKTSLENMLMSGFDKLKETATDAAEATPRKLIESLESKIQEISKKPIPEMIQDDDDSEESTAQNISLNNTNSIGSKASYTDVTPISPRNKDDSLTLALARSTVTV